MAWAIITIYISKCAQMNPQQLHKTSKFYSRCKKCDIEKTLGGGYHDPLVARRIMHWNMTEQTRNESAAKCELKSGGRESGVKKIHFSREIKKIDFAWQNFRFHRQKFAMTFFILPRQNLPYTASTISLQKPPLSNVGTAGLICAIT